MAQTASSPKRNFRGGCESGWRAEGAQQPPKDASFDKLTAYDALGKGDRAAAKGLVVENLRLDGAVEFYEEMRRTAGRQPQRNTNYCNFPTR